jgi:predicted phosphodiesterase
LKIQFFSDIHLEFGTFDIPATDADVIVAAGDSGVGLQGVDWLSQCAKPIIYVAGNQEYYGGDIVHTRIALAERAGASHVAFLENQSYEINDVRFLGTTMWTDYSAGDAQVMQLAIKNMNDFQQIRCASRPLKPEQLYDINWESCSWLAGELEKPFTGKTVVVTHHAPSSLSWPNTGNETHRENYCNRLDDFFTRYDIQAWFHGHVHNVADYVVNKTRVLCNPRGYTGYQVIDGFSAAKTIEI